MNMTTKIYAGFGAVLILAIFVAGFGTYNLTEASGIFAKYRSLARQTNADGRVQANMLMTRIFAKNFVISATPENIDGVNERAKQTLSMIEEVTNLGTDSRARGLLVEELESDLRDYVSEFEEVTQRQAERNTLVEGQLNVLGPQTERALTDIMQSALKDGDTEAAYQAGLTLRSLLLGRLYANQFLISNDDESVDRAMREFRDMELNLNTLLGKLENPNRRTLAESVQLLQRQYMDAFVEVRRVIDNRNTIIKYQLDRIGPHFADRIERLKLAIKEEQDSLGPLAQASFERAEAVMFTVSAIAIFAGLGLAGWIAAGIVRPVRTLTQAATALAAGDLGQAVDTNRRDEIGTLASAFVAMRAAIEDKVQSLEKEISERTRAENERAAAQAELKRINETLEETVQARTAELTSKENQLRVALTNMSDGFFTLDKHHNYELFNDRYVAMTGSQGESITKGRPIEDSIREAAEAGCFGPGDVEDLVKQHCATFTSDAHEEVEATTIDGHFLNYRKSPLEGGGAVVVVSDVTSRRIAERELSDAFNNISHSIDYASRIQQAILPPAESLSERFEDHFVIWEPRDVVGGDIYWSHSWGDGELVVLGDCTGHGVPGAFMTLISTGALERAMSEVDEGDASALVQRMHQLVRQSLGQDNNVSNANDGLELGACYVEADKGRVSFVGARFDLFFTRNGELEQVRSGKKGIGYPEVPADHQFETTVVDASPGTHFYMTTDGAVDQINDNGRRRFGKNRFKELLKSVQDMPMPQQGRIILDTIKEYQGDAPRLDDIAIVGFNIGQ